MSTLGGPGPVSRTSNHFGQPTMDALAGELGEKFNLPKDESGNHVLQSPNGEANRETSPLEQYVPGTTPDLKGVDVSGDLERDRRRQVKEGKLKPDSGDEEWLSPEELEGLELGPDLKPLPENIGDGEQDDKNQTEGSAEGGSQQALAMKVSEKMPDVSALADKAGALAHTATEYAKDHPMQVAGIAALAAGGVALAVFAPATLPAVARTAAIVL
jgi:hypothetical protein